jgi:hypothetical protein
MPAKMPASIVARRWTRPKRAGTVMTARSTVSSKKASALAFSTCTSRSMHLRKVHYFQQHASSRTGKSTLEGVAAHSAQASAQHRGCRAAAWRVPAHSQTSFGAALTAHLQHFCGDLRGRECSCCRAAQQSPAITVLSYLKWQRSPQIGDLVKACSDEAFDRVERVDGVPLRQRIAANSDACMSKQESHLPAICTHARMHARTHRPQKQRCDPCRPIRADPLTNDDFCGSEPPRHGHRLPALGISSCTLSSGHVLVKFGNIWRSASHGHAQVSCIAFAWA